MKDSIGDRIKNFYENRTRIYLPRRTHTIIRIDGKCFSNYTKGLTRSFDKDFITDLDETARFLCKEIQGAKLAFVHVSASIATAKFNRLRDLRNVEISGFADEEWVDFSNIKLAMFDSRVFTIPAKQEVINYFIWRQQDTVRNSISSLAQSLYSHKKLNKKTTNEMQEMCFQKGT